MERGNVGEGIGRTMSVNPGDPFYSANAETTPNQLVMNGKKDSPRLSYLKFVLNNLIEKISVVNSEATLQAMRVEMEMFLDILKEIATSKKAPELNCLKIHVEKLGISGKARVLVAIANNITIGEELKKNMKKIILMK